MFKEDFSKIITEYQREDCLRREIIKFLNSVINGNRELPEVRWDYSNRIPIYSFNNGVNITVLNEKRVYIYKGDKTNPREAYMLDYAIDVTDRLDEIFVRCSAQGKVNMCKEEKKDFEDIIEFFK